MSTGAAYAEITPKKILGYQDFSDRMLDYIRERTRESVNLAFSTDGVFTAALGLSADGADKFKITGASEATDGLGNILTAANAPHTAIQFENTVSVPYYVGLKYNSIPSGVIVNPRTGMPDFLNNLDYIGEEGTPDSIIDNGNGTLTFRVDGVCETGVSNAGRQVLVFKNLPGKNATTAALAIETCTVAFTGGQNRITTASNFGQTANSTTLADYTVVLLGPTVKRNTDLRTLTNVTFVGIVTGAGAGVAPSVFSTVDQNVIGLSLTNFAEITRIDPHGKLKVQVRADASDSGEDQIRVQDSGGTTRFQVDEAGNATIGGNLTVQGTTTQQNFVQVNSSETITGNLTAGDAATDHHVIKGIWDHTDVAGTAKYLYIDGSTGHIGVGKTFESTHQMAVILVGGSAGNAGLAVYGSATVTGTSAIVAYGGGLGDSGQASAARGAGIIGVGNGTNGTASAGLAGFGSSGNVAGVYGLGALAGQGGYFQGGTSGQGVVAIGGGATRNAIVACTIDFDPTVVNALQAGAGIVAVSDQPTANAVYGSGSSGAGGVRGISDTGAGVYGSPSSTGVGVLGGSASGANVTAGIAAFPGAAALAVADSSGPALGVWCVNSNGIVIKGGNASGADLTTMLGNWSAPFLLTQRTTPAMYVESNSTIASLVIYNFGVSGNAISAVSQGSGAAIVGTATSTGSGIIGFGNNLSAPNQTTVTTAAAKAGVAAGTDATGSSAVYAYNLSASGAGSHGVTGQSISTASVGVLGLSAAATLANANTAISNMGGQAGVFGFGPLAGVAGEASAANSPGVFGSGTTGTVGGAFTGGSKFYTDVMGLRSTHQGSAVLAYTALSSTDSSGVYGRHGANNASTHGIFGEHEGIGNGVTGKSGSSGLGGNFSSSSGAAIKLTSNATRGHLNLSGTASPTTPLAGDFWYQSTGGANLLRLSTNGTNYVDVMVRHLSSGYTAAPIGASSASWTASSLDSVTLPTTGEIHGRMYVALQMFNNTGSAQTQTISFKWGANTFNNFSLAVATSATPTLAIVECEFQIKSDGTVNAASSLQYGGTSQTSFANLSGASGTNQFTISGTNSANNANLSVIRQRAFVEFIAPSSQGRVA